MLIAYFPFSPLTSAHLRQSCALRSTPVGQRSRSAASKICADTGRAITPATLPQTASATSGFVPPLQTLAAASDFYISTGDFSESRHLMPRRRHFRLARKEKRNTQPPQRLLAMARPRAAVAISASRAPEV